MYDTIWTISKVTKRGWITLLLTCLHSSSSLFPFSTLFLSLSLKKMKLSFCATTVAFAAWVIPCVYGQSGCSGDIKVTAQGDLDALRSCKSFKGSITIDGTAANQLTLDGVQHIDGDLNVKNNEVLSRLSLPNLQAVNGVVNLENNKALNSLDMPYLSAVRSFTMAVHPALPSISFPAGLSQVDRLMISDTTTTRIEGVKASQIGELVVDNNIYLKSLNLGNLSKVTTGLTVSANSPSLTLDVSSSFFSK